MTNIISYLINQGVSQEALIYILLAPLVATLIVFLRQIIGLKGIGVYYPLLLTYIFISIGLKEGLILFLLIAFLANIITYLVKRFPLLYMPRLTIVLTVIVLVLLLIISVIHLSDYSLSLENYLPIIITLALSDKLVSVQIKRNLRPAIFLTGGTIIVAILGYLTLNIGWIQRIAFKYPLLFLLSLLIINVFLGRFKGLRLNEIWRFRRLLRSSSKN